MANKVWTDSGEKKAWFFARLFLAIICFLFILFGFIVAPSSGANPTDHEFLWDALHPASVVNWIGVVLFFGFVFYLSGLWEKITGPVTIMGVGLNSIGFAFGVLGIILIWV